MGKVQVTGSAKREFVADNMEVRISISTSRETSALAISDGKKDTEKMLEFLIGLGFDLSSLTMEKEELSAPSPYHDNKSYYFTKTISFKTSANLALLEAISDGISKNNINATYSETFHLSNINSATELVLQDALLDSQKKAESTVRALGKKIVGIESVNVDYFTDTFVGGTAPCLGESHFASSSYGSKLSADVVAIDKSVDVTWIME